MGYHLKRFSKPIIFETTLKLDINFGVVHFGKDNCARPCKKKSVSHAELEFQKIVNIIIIQISFILV